MPGLRYLTNVTTLSLDQTKCNGCRMCEKVCPHGVFAIDHRNHYRGITRNRTGLLKLRSIKIM